MVCIHRSKRFVQDSSKRFDNEVNDFLIGLRGEFILEVIVEFTPEGSCNEGSGL